TQAGHSHDVGDEHDADAGHRQLEVAPHYADNQTLQQSAALLAALVAGLDGGGGGHAGRPGALGREDGGIIDPADDVDRDGGAYHTSYPHHQDGVGLPHQKQHGHRDEAAVGGRETGGGGNGLQQVLPLQVTVL